jgi:hypothetical protein
MRPLVSLSILIAALLAVASPARAAVLDFNATTADDYLFAPYDEDGLRLMVASGHYDFFGPGLWNLTSGVCPNNFLNVDDSVYGAAAVRNAPLGGGTFDVQSLDLLDTYQYNQQTSQFSACGAGCLVRSSLGGELQLATTGTVNFAGAAWTGVEWIEISARSLNGLPSIASVAVDNITVAVTAVPAPSAAWLLATGLAGVVARARRRRRD